MTYTLINSSEEENLLQKLILDFEIDETCVRELLELTKNIYSNLDYSISGAKSDLTQGIKQIIEKHIEQEALTETPQ